MRSSRCLIVSLPLGCLEDHDVIQTNLTPPRKCTHTCLVQARNIKSVGVRSGWDMKQTCRVRRSLSLLPITEEHIRPHASSPPSCCCFQAGGGRRPGAFLLFQCCPLLIMDFPPHRPCLCKRSVVRGTERQPSQNLDFHEEPLTAFSVLPYCICSCHSLWRAIFHGKD